MMDPKGGYSSSSRKVSELTNPPAGPAPGAKQNNEAKDYQRALSIDFSIIAEAQMFYGLAGYKNTAVPWVVGAEAYEDTKPKDAIAYETLGGFLVASAEQSFLQLMLQGKSLGKAQATTPCFRDEMHDEIHAPYFMKTELIITDVVTEKSLEELVVLARRFFNQFLPTDVLSFEDGTLDIVCSKTQLELGSYGIRKHKDLAWVYGTGVALPRLSYALAQLK